MITRYLISFDKDGLQLVASDDAVWHFDQRISDKTALERYAKRIEKQADAWLDERAKDGCENRVVKPRAQYAQIVRDGPGGVGVVVLHDTCYLNNPLD